MTRSAGERPRGVRRLVVPVLAVLCSVATAGATLNLSPTRLVLTGKASSGSLLLRNESDAPMRFQVNASRWANGPSGELDLTPTTDLIFFPSLFVLEPKQSRRLRVATAVTASDRELAYRLLIEQLPDAARPPGQGVQMLVRASLPVFVQPPTLTARATLDALAIERADGAGAAQGEAARGSLSLACTVRNTGTVHLMLRDVELRGRVRTGADAPPRQVAGWYLLPNETRRFHLPLPAEACDAWSAARVTATFSEGLTQTLVESIDLPSGACDRRGMER